MSFQQYSKHDQTMTPATKRYISGLGEFLSVITEAEHYLHPVQNESHRCTIMLLFNFAQAEWMSIPCTRKLLNEILCQLHAAATPNRNGLDNQIEMKSCPRKAIVVNRTCHFFTWYKSDRPESFSKGAMTKHWISIFETIEGFQVIFNAIAAKFPPVLSPMLTHIETKKFMRHTYQRQFTYLKYYSFVQPVSSVEGFLISTSHQNSIVKGSNLFECKSGSFASQILVCDGKSDCSDRDASDENISVCNKERIECHNRYSEIKMCVGSPLFFVTAKGDLSRYTFGPSGTQDNFQSKTSVKYDSLLCNNTRKIENFLVDDLVGDCGLDAGDEPILKSLLQLGNSFPCENPSQIACRQHHPRCYNMTEICTFRLSKYNTMMPCRNGGHLESCRQFECNTMFKCLVSYCIPWRYVRDGKWDCPVGDDEKLIFQKQEQCRNLFRCQNTSICISIGNTCDGQIDCPQGDDEYLCSTAQTYCPVKCDCLVLAMLCINTTLQITQGKKYPYLALTLYRSETNLRKYLYLFSGVVFAQFFHTNLTDICTVEFPTKLLYLDLSYNFVKRLEENCLFELLKIKVLLLEHNRISVVEPKIVNNLTKLIVFSLSDNPIQSIPNFVSLNFKNLKVFFLENVHFNNIDADILDGCDIQVIHTTDFHLCCLASLGTTCTAHRPWFRNCFQFIPNKALKIVFTSISCFILALSGGSACCTVKNITKQSILAYSLTVIAINGDDLLCGVYLSIIWISDLHFHNAFSVNEQNWRSSAVCFWAFATVVLFTTATQCVHFFLSLSRFMVIFHPVETKFKKTSFAVHFLATTHISLALVALFLTLTLAFTETHLPSNLCSPFVDPNNTVVVLKFVTWFTVLSQLATSVAVATTHICLIHHLKESQKNLTRSTGSQFVASVAVQLAAMSLFNILCWLPANTVYVACMFLSFYPFSLTIWTTALAFPLNSVFQPLLFLIVSFKKYIKPLL